MNDDYWQENICRFVADYIQHWIEKVTLHKRVAEKFVVDLWCCCCENDNNHKKNDEKRELEKLLVKMIENMGKQQKQWKVTRIVVKLLAFAQEFSSTRNSQKKTKIMDTNFL